MDPESGGGGLSNIPKPVLFAGAGVGLVLLYVFWKDRQSSTSSSTNTASGVPSPGQGLIEPIIINPGGPSQPSKPPGFIPPSTINPGGPFKPGPVRTVPVPQPANNPGNTAITQPSEQYLNQEIGDFGALWKLRTPTAAAVKAEEAKVGGVSTIDERMNVQNWNVGQLTSLNHLKTPTVAQIKALAAQENPDFAKLSPAEQNIAMQLANISLLEKLNPRPS